MLYLTSRAKITRIHALLTLFTVPLEPRLWTLFFTGEHKVSLDKQRRLSIPTRWRGDFGQHGGYVLTMEPLEHKSLYLYPSTAYEKVMKGLDASGKQNDPWVMAIMDSLRRVSPEEVLDAQGRIKMPESLCERAGIGKDVLAIGRDSKVELCDPSSFESRFKPAGLPPTHEGNPSFYDDIRF